MVSKGRTPLQKIKIFWPPCKRIEYTSEDPDLSSDESDTYEFGVSAWFEGAIKSFNEETGEHEIEYGDHTCEHLNLLKLNSDMPAWELAPCGHFEYGNWLLGRL